MSEEFEDISVAETEPVEVASVDPAMTSEVTEVLPAEIDATKINLDPADEILKNNSQQVYAENYLSDRVSESATLMTAAAIAAREDAKEEKRNEAFEYHQTQLKQLEARNEFLNKDHDFGGMKMSGADLEKLMNFISNPAMQDKLRERLGKSGMPKEKIDKGMKELNEYIELKKKEQEGKLSEEDQRRLREINKSEDFKVVAQTLDSIAREDGVVFEANKTKDVMIVNTTNNKEVATTKTIQLNAQDINSSAEVASNKKAFENEFSSQSAAYAHFSTAPHLGDEFASKVAVSKPVPIANDMKVAAETTAPAAVVAQATKSKAVDLSFG